MSLEVFKLLIKDQMISNMSFASKMLENLQEKVAPIDVK